MRTGILQSHPGKMEYQTRRPRTPFLVLEAGESEIQSLPQLHEESETSLGYRRPYFRKKKKKKEKRFCSVIPSIYVG